MWCASPTGPPEVATAPTSSSSASSATGYSALEALVADYTRQAERLDAIPMAVSPDRSTLEDEAA